MPRPMRRNLPANPRESNGMSANALRRFALIASGALLVAACQQAQQAAVPTASPPPIADTRATATLSPTYTQPAFGAAVPASPIPAGGGGGGGGAPSIGGGGADA